MGSVFDCNTGNNGEFGVENEENKRKIVVLNKTNELTALLTIIRNKETPIGDFVFYSDRIIRLLIEEGISHLEFIPQTVTTPIGNSFSGLEFCGKICGISILRAGEAMEKALRDCCRSIRIGKILIQKDENHQPKLYYYRFPVDVTERSCLVLDPMLASGKSASLAINLLLESGVTQEKIIFISLIASKSGIDHISNQFPRLTIVCAEVDDSLNDKGYIVPGLGDFGSRYFGTDVKEF